VQRACLLNEQRSLPACIFPDSPLLHSFYSTMVTWRWQRVRPRLHQSAPRALDPPMHVPLRRQLWLVCRPPLRPRPRFLLLLLPPSRRGARIYPRQRRPLLLTRMSARTPRRVTRLQDRSQVEELEGEGLIAPPFGAVDDWAVAMLLQA
jgi:hypothetical protein